MTDLRELAERVEAATGPDRELDALITVALDLRADWLRDQEGEIWFGGEFIGDEPVIRFKSTVIKRRGIGNTPSAFCPAFTASLDAAMSLVPEGWTYEAYQGPSGQPHRWKLRTIGDGDKFYTEVEAKAATPALALTAAALRAREEDRG